MIALPPDGRQVNGAKIEALVHTLDELVTGYLNMLSVADRPRGTKTVRDTFAAYPVLKKILEL